MSQITVDVKTVEQLSKALFNCMDLCSRINYDSLLLEIASQDISFADSEKLELARAMLVDVYLEKLQERTNRLMEILETNRSYLRFILAASGNKNI